RICESQRGRRDREAYRGRSSQSADYASLIRPTRSDAVFRAVRAPRHLKIPAHPVDEKESTMTAPLILVPSDPAQSMADLHSRLHHALKLLLTHRGDPLAEIDRVLADDPHCVSGHCLRAAAIVRADAVAARPRLVPSLAAIEAACPDANDPARRHADAA